MNNNQIASLVRLLLNTLSGAILAWTASKSQPAKDLAGYLVQFINGPDALALVCSGVAWLWGHLTHSAPNPTGGGSKTGGVGLLVSLGVASVLLLSGLTGCQTTAQQATYQAAGTASVTVEAALHAYDVFAAQGKTTPAQNAAVKAAYEKYQSAFAVVCDAGAVYASTVTTNAPAASAALQTAIVNANQTISDLVNLIRSFGVTI